MLVLPSLGLLAYQAMSDRRVWAAAGQVEAAAQLGKLDAAAIETGRGIYGQSCAGCHGAALEGQSRWEQPNAAGRFPAPPLDATGHAWQHSDAELLHIIGSSLADQSPPGYASDMPAFQGRLSPAAMEAVLAYLKSRWPAQVRLYQSMLNSGGPPAAPWPADWRFPVSCKAIRAQALRLSRTAR
jgi:mono/diheme cytochrome c family protein